MRCRGPGPLGELPWRRQSPRQPEPGLPFCAPEMLGSVDATVNAVSTLKCSTLTMPGVMWQTIIHGVFICSAIGIAWTDRIMQAGVSRVRERH